MENIQEYASEMPYEGSPLQLQREVEFLRTANKNLHDQLQSFWNTHVVPLESEIKALREEQERCLKALEQLANYNKNLLEEIERLKAELKNANSALDNISDMGHA